MLALAGYGSDGEDDSDAASPRGPPPRDGGHPILGSPSKKRPRVSRESLPAPPPRATTAGGRVRSFPHVDGDFATHVFLPVSVPPGARALLARRLAACIARVPALRPVGRDAPTPPDARGDDLIPRDAHVSLSRVFATRANQREGVLASLRRALVAAEAFDVDVGPAFRVFVNDQRTATFLALEVRERRGGDRTSPGVTTREASDGDGGDARDGGDGDGDVVSVSSFAGLVRAVDAALAPAGCPPFYAHPAPHVSALWAPGDVRAEVDAAIARERASDPDPNREGEGARASWTARVGRAVCRVSGFPEFTVWGRPPAGSLPSAGALLRGDVG